MGAALAHSAKQKLEKCYCNCCTFMPAKMEEILSKPYGRFHQQINQRMHACKNITFKKMSFFVVKEP